jgi:hypothetical protein
MNKPIAKILLNAFLMVVLVIAALFLYELIKGNPPPPPEHTPTVTSGQPILEAIKHVNKQIFIEHYNAVDVSYTEAPAEWLKAIVRQEFIVLLRGRVPAGFDLEGLTLDDIWISADGSRIQLTLPPPVIFEDNVSVDFENSRILARSDTCPGFLCEDPVTAYQNEVLPYGKTRLVEYARQSGILDQVARDGKVYYEQLLKSLGFEEVRIVVTGYDL